LTVTRDYGAKTLVEATDGDPPESETVIRLLDREAEITTRYGGGFVQSIDGLAGTQSGGRRDDWFFYVNGVESSVGGADVRVRGGDRIWWDYRDWTDAMRVPAVVGSWPEPFAQASAVDGRLPVRVECAGAKPPCQTTARRLAEERVSAGVVPFGRHGDQHALRVLVGPWRRIRRDPAARLEGPAASGVFATFKPGGHGRFELVLADSQAEPRRGFRDRAGLVAAVDDEEGPPTWLVTGTDAAGVRKASAMLDQHHLRDRYAVAAPPEGPPLSVPVSVPSRGEGP